MLLDAISISILPAWLGLFIYGLWIKSETIIAICVFAVVVDVTTQLLKTFLGNYISASILHRPDKNAKCSMLNRNSNEKWGTFAIPSGHMTSVVIFAIAFVFIFQNNFVVLTGILYIVLMAFARYYKKCHNLLQIIAGILYGSLLGFVIITIIKNYLKK
jgi:membrane-associated phospholipid phosphatase